MAAYSQADYLAMYIATGIACAMVAGGWLVLAVGATIGVRTIKNRQVAGLDPAETGEPGGLKYLLYFLAVFFWPAALAIGAYLLAKPRSAPAGAMCLYILLGYLTLSVAIAVAAVGTFVFVNPDSMMMVLNA